MSLDNFDFDPFDDDLTRRLQAAAPASDSSDAILEALRPRLRDARRRRRAVVVGAPGLAAAVVLAVVLTVAGPNGGNSRVGITPATGSPKTTTTAEAPKQIFTPPPTSPVPHSSSKGGGGTIPAPPTPSDGGGGTGTPSPETHTYTSAGGSITVRFADGALSLLSTQPATGFSPADVHDNGPTRVEVSFDNGHTDWQIRVDVVEGHLSVEITSDGGGGGGS